MTVQYIRHVKTLYMSVKVLCVVYVVNDTMVLCTNSFTLDNCLLITTILYHQGPVVQSWVSAKPGLNLQYDM